MALGFEEVLHVVHLFALRIQGGQNSNGCFPNHFTTFFIIILCFIESLYLKYCGDMVRLLRLLSFPEATGPVSLLNRNFKIELLYFLQKGGQVIGNPLEDSIALLFTGA